MTTVAAKLTEMIWGLDQTQIFAHFEGFCDANFQRPAGSDSRRAWLVQLVGWRVLRMPSESEGRRLWEAIEAVPEGATLHNEQLILRCRPRLRGYEADKRWVAFILKFFSPVPVEETVSLDEMAQLEMCFWQAKVVKVSSDAWGFLEVLRAFQESSGEAKTLVARFMGRMKLSSLEFSRFPSEARVNFDQASIERFDQFTNTVSLKGRAIIQDSMAAFLIKKYLAEAYRLISLSSRAQEELKKLLEALPLEDLIQEASRFIESLSRVADLVHETRRNTSPIAEVFSEYCESDSSSCFQNFTRSLLAYKLCKIKIVSIWEPLFVSFLLANNDVKLQLIVRASYLPTLLSLPEQASQDCDALKGIHPVELGKLYLHFLMMSEGREGTFEIRRAFERYFKGVSLSEPLLVELFSGAPLSANLLDRLNTLRKWRKQVLERSQAVLQELKSFEIPLEAYPSLYNALLCATPTSQPDYLSFDGHIFPLLNEGGETSFFYRWSSRVKEKFRATFLVGDRRFTVRSSDEEELKKQCQLLLVDQKPATEVDYTSLLTPLLERSSATFFEGALILTRKIQTAGVVQVTGEWGAMEDVIYYPVTTPSDQERRWISHFINQCQEEQKMSIKETLAAILAPFLSELSFFLDQVSSKDETTIVNEVLENERLREQRLNDSYREEMRQMLMKMQGRPPLDVMQTLLWQGQEWAAQEAGFAVDSLLLQGDQLLDPFRCAFLPLRRLGKIPDEVKLDQVSNKQLWKGKALWHKKILSLFIEASPVGSDLLVSLTKAKSKMQELSAFFDFDEPTAYHDPDRLPRMIERVKILNQLSLGATMSIKWDQLQRLLETLSETLSKIRSEISARRSLMNSGAQAAGGTAVVLERSRQLSELTEHLKALASQKAPVPQLQVRSSTVALSFVDGQTALQFRELLDLTEEWMQNEVKNSVKSLRELYEGHLAENITHARSSWIEAKVRILSSKKSDIEKAKELVHQQMVLQREPQKRLYRPIREGLATDSAMQEFLDRRFEIAPQSEQTVAEFRREVDSLSFQMMVEINRQSDQGTPLHTFIKEMMQWALENSTVFQAQRELVESVGSLKATILNDSVFSRAQSARGRKSNEERLQALITTLPSPRLSEWSLAADDPLSERRSQFLGHVETLARATGFLVQKQGASEYEKNLGLLWPKALILLSSLSPSSSGGTPRSARGTPR